MCDSTGLSLDLDVLFPVLLFFLTINFSLYLWLINILPLSLYSAVFYIGKLMRVWSVVAAVH